MAEDTRYPYTYSCDFIRSVAGYGPGGTKLSRSDASKIRSNFSSILGIPDEEVAKKLADYYLAHKEEIAEEDAKALVAILIPEMRR